MVKCNIHNISIKTNKNKSWPYDEYYLGETDEDSRLSGKGENHWTGAESIEWYTGSFVLNTMHGRGDYRWRHYREEGTANTYEGHFYANTMHGYGTISYADGKVFRGLLWNNSRWGPGIESHPCQSENVGLWYDGRLMRLTWGPPTLSLIPNFVTLPAGANLLKKHRNKLTANTLKIGETNSAMDLLKTCGCDPQLAGEKWRQLYPRFCTNLNSLLCDNKTFNKKYYHGDILTLEEYTEVKKSLSTLDDGMLPREETETPPVYYVWNNSTPMTEMMQHCYTHDHQRERTGLNLTNIISGPRKMFKSAGIHELDCRSVLMASYLGHAAIVAHLVNDRTIHPDVADVVGNTPLMYAVCGDQVETIQFLLEAGAEVDNFNDSCFTALGLALMRYVTRYLDVPPFNMAQVMVPMDAVPVKGAAKEPKSAQIKTTQPAPPQDEPVEWIINREVIITVVSAGIPKAMSLTARLGSIRKLKSLSSMKSISAMKRKAMNRSRGRLDAGSDNDLCETNRNLYHSLSHEFLIRVSDVLTQSPQFVVQSIFDCTDMISEIDQFEGQKVEKSADKLKKVASKVLKVGVKPSKELAVSGADISVIDSEDKLKIESLSQIHTTILKLLQYGADPKLVRCPLPALVLAVKSESEELVRDLLRYGADPHQSYTEMLNYTALELAISGPLTTENLNVIIALLQAGSRVDYRMPYDARDPVDDSIILGPTLLHAVLAKRTAEDNEDFVDLQKQLLNVLLDYGCDAALQFRGQSAVDLAMTRNMTLLDLFVKNSKVNLNSVINETNQTLLTKIFNFKYFRTMDRTDIITTLTNLMLFGADPLLPCQNEEITYQNFYVYAKEELFEAIENGDKEKSPAKGDGKGNKTDKSSKADKGGSKPEKGPKSVEKGKGADKKNQGKTLAEDIEDYKQALQIVTDCSRLVHTRWLQAQLVKELIDVVHNITHRSWHIIMRDHKQPKQAGLWLTAQRVLEIWDILKTTKKKIYGDKKLLRHILCIVHYYNFRKYLKKKLTASEKDTIDENVRILLREQPAESVSTEIIPWKLHYVTPELDKQKSKYDVCLECSLPFTDEKIKCYKCKIVFFCCMECIHKNVGRINCHPCSEYLKQRYFPAVEEEQVNVDDNLKVL